MCVIKRYLPEKMVEALIKNGRADYFLNRVKGDLKETNRKFTELTTYYKGYNAKFELKKETNEYVYFCITDMQVNKEIELAVSRKTLAIYCNYGQVTNAVQYFINEMFSVAEMLSWDYIPHEIPNNMKRGLF